MRPELLINVKIKSLPKNINVYTNLVTLLLGHLVTLLYRLLKAFLCWLLPTLGLRDLVQKIIKPVTTKLKYSH